MFYKSVIEIKFVMNAWTRLFDEDIGLYDKTGKFFGDWENLPWLDCETSFRCFAQLTSKPTKALMV